MSDHTFVICAYQESPYLEECIQSLLGQTIPAHILMATSTPNEHIRALARKYDLPLFVNPGEGGITQDWNFALSLAETPYVTLAHQDDVYLERYTEKVLALLREAKGPLICFTDYGEMRDGKAVLQNSLLRIKRLMLLPLRLRPLWSSRWVRRRILSLGCPICCPSVTYARENLPPVLFRKGFRSCEDWEAWEALSGLRGEFVYCDEVLMYHRIHAGSETSAIIGDHARSGEEYEMFRKFWPDPVARMLVRVYAKGQDSNQM